MGFRTIFLLFLLYPLTSQAVDPTVLTCADKFAAFGETSNGFSFEEVTSGILALKTHGKLRTLSPDLIEDLMHLGKVNEKEELLKPEIQNKILEFIASKEINWEEKFGKSAVALKSALLNSKPAEKERRFIDINRGWGWQLLEDSDPAFQDPKYLAKSLKSSGASGEVMGLRSSTSAISNFSQAWKRAVPPNVSAPTRFALTGTDANNSLYDIAEDVVRRKKVKGPAEIIAFEGSYAGVNGKISKLGHMGNRQDRSLLIESPHTPYWNPTDPVEIARLEILEKNALAAIREKFSQNAPAIGGFLLEPILGSKGVYFYRPEFLRALRQLCDEFQIPIFADEILNGGGRTGKFFSYQLYEGFEPDFVTFGKGLQVAGVAQVKRENAPGLLKYLDQAKSGPVTLTHYEEPLNKGAQIINRVVDGNLEKNAEDRGKYFLAKLREFYANKKLKELQREIGVWQKSIEQEKASLAKILDVDLQKRPDQADYVARWKREYQERIDKFTDKLKQAKSNYARLKKNPNGNPDIRGKGMLIYGGDEFPVPTAMGRLMPPLSLSKQEIDQFFIEVEKGYSY